MREEILINLIDKDILRNILVAGKLISIKTNENEMYKCFKEFLLKNRTFSKTIRSLPNEQLDSFNKFLRKEFENINLEKANYPIGNLPIKLTEYLSSDAVEKAKKKKGILDKLYQDANKKTVRLTPLSFKEFMDKEDNKEYYVKNMFAKGTINMIYSPPASMKSFVSYYLGICLATGKKFLNQKTKKVNIGYFDWENPLSDVQNRVKGICKGMDIELNTIDNFYFFPKQPSLLRVTSYDSYVSTDLRQQLLEFIKENDIKVLFFDTLRRLGNFDENDSKSINIIKSELFDPLINEHNVCVIFLHHTSKEGKNYRGSVDIEGILDTAFSIEKKNTEDGASITIKNTKRRNNELESISSFVTIENEEYEDEEGEMYERIIEVKFNKKEGDEINDAGEYSQYRNYFIDNLEIGKQYKNKELVDMLGFTFSISSSKTTSKILKWLCKIDVLKSFGERRLKYYILNPSYATDDQNSQLIELKKHFIGLFQTNDYVRIKDLKSKFDEKYFSLIVEEWNKKGWLNVSKKDYLGVTDLFITENRKVKVDEVNLQ